MERDEQHIEFNDLIVRYLSDEMTAAEKEQFEHMIKAEPGKMEQFNAYQKIWDGVDQLAGRGKYDMDAEWSMLSEKINLEAGAVKSGGKINLEAEEMKSGGKINFEAEETKSNGKPLRSRSLRTSILRIAAVLVIGLLGVAGWYGGRQMLMYDRVAVETGTRKIELPDGSVLTLNSGSTVRYSTRESLSYRKVKLSGEAFFEVARDTSRPFIINAGPAQIEVLGTSFNVNAYPDNAAVEVTVSSGLVAMSAKQDRDNLIMLNKGNTGVYSKERSALNLIAAGDVNAVAWKTRVLEFNETSLKDVVAALNHTYQTNIVIENSELTDLTITVSFNNQELDAVLNVLASTLDLKIEIRGSKITINAED